MSGRSLLVIMICTLVIACSIAESLPGSKNGAGAAGNASPEEFTAALVAGLSAQNGGVSRPNVAPSVVDSRFANSGHGEGEGEGEEAARVSPLRVAGISSAQNSGFGTSSGSGAAKLSVINVEARAQLISSLSETPKPSVQEPLPVVAEPSPPYGPATFATRPPRPSYPTPPQLPPIAETSSRSPYPTQVPPSNAYPPTVPVIAETPSSKITTARPIARPVPVTQPIYSSPVQDPAGISNPPTVPVIVETPLQ